MKYHKIEIDEEVFEYLKDKAEAFVDTPNTVLRRELLQKRNKTVTTNKVSTRFPELPSGIPTALRHTLEVIYMVRERGMSRPDATKSVAEHHSVEPQTVLDKYCRQLDRKAYEIDRLLDEADLSNFKRILRQKYMDHTSTIENFFSSLNS